MSAPDGARVNTVPCAPGIGVCIGGPRCRQEGACIKTRADVRQDGMPERRLQDALAAVGVSSCVTAVPGEDGPRFTVSKPPGNIDIVALGRVCAWLGWSVTFRESSGFQFSLLPLNAPCADLSALPAVVDEEGTL